MCGLSLSKERKIVDNPMKLLTSIQKELMVDQRTEEGLTPSPLVQGSDSQLCSCRTDPTPGHRDLCGRCESTVRTPCFVLHDHPVTGPLHSGTSKDHFPRPLVRSNHLNTDTQSKIWSQRSRCFTTIYCKSFGNTPELLLYYYNLRVGTWTVYVTSLYR